MQRLIGVIIGGFVTFLLLLLFQGPDGPRIVSDATMGYLVAVVIGAVVTWAWPVVIAWWLVRRHRSREQARIEAEVQRQVAQQKGGNRPNT
jgi:hypothetical protein